MSSSPGTHTTCNCKSASQAEVVHNGNEKAVGAQVDEKNDKETEPDIATWSFPTPEVSHPRGAIEGVHRRTEGEGLDRMR
ncbi:hypothetical protein OH76DRAFT_1023012 [Lentinus brumalis]|uniref:Uncharacterized protein n=1 Tax=Lentinus brumalis TaxID=2498619 RepID=A0A371CY09_9APHY|nr:hypothetical protein OH76DRAFT_1023012 [Polyporus brumalis]